MAALGLAVRVAVGAARLTPAASKIIRTGGVLTRANNIRRTTGLVKAAASPALIKKTPLLARVGRLFQFVTGVDLLVDLWNWLNKPKVKPDAPIYEPVEGEFDLNLSPGYHDLIFRWRETNSDPSIYSCQTGDIVYQSSGPLTQDYLARFQLMDPTKVRLRKVSLMRSCSSSGNVDETTRMSLLEVWGTSGPTTQWWGTSQFYPDGTEYTSSFYREPKTWTAQVLEFADNGELVPSPIPTPKPNPVPRPDPVPMPEAEPEMVPQKPKVVPIAPPIPQTVPDAQPLPQPAPAPGRAPVKTPVKTPVRTSPQIRPTVPQRTTETTIAGKQVPPSKPPVPTTPSDVHKFGNAGGRVAGRTASIRPTQVAQELGRVEQKLAQIANRPNTIGDLADLARLLGFIYDYLLNQKPGTTYELQGVCECPEGDDECEEPKLTIETPGGDYRDETLARLDAVAEMLQPLKSWKQPICSVEKPKLEGDWRTISFISDERTLAGDRYLSKRFRYRSQSGTDLAGLVDHWKDFTWDAGPVCVIHSGHSWGSPQVWAASIDEGKRVIQHAGREAGVDPDQVGKWVISGSRNPRFGLPGKMRVNTKGGFYWITERLGSSARPLVVPT